MNDRERARAREKARAAANEARAAIMLSPSLAVFRAISAVAVALDLLADVSEAQEAELDELRERGKA